MLFHSFFSHPKQFFFFFLCIIFFLISSFFFLLSSFFFLLSPANRLTNRADLARVEMLELRLRRMIEDASINEASLKRLFSRFDKDNSGKLSRQEMKRVFTELGIKSTDAEMSEVLLGLDRSNDGLCSYEEFVRIAFPSSGLSSARPGSTSPLATLLTERLRTMIQRAAGSERELRALFTKFDTQNTGRITRAKFQKAFANMGLSAPAKEVQELVDSLDTNGDGMVSYGEFVSVVHEQRRDGGANGSSRMMTSFPSRVEAVLQRLVDDASWTQSSIRRLFRTFDKDNSGYITRSEFRRAFADLNVRATDNEIDELLRVIDTNHDGRISYSEFLDVAYKGKKSGGGGGDRRDGGRSERGGRGYDDDESRGRRRGGSGGNGGGGMFGRSDSALVDKFKDAMRRAKWTRSTLTNIFDKFDLDRSGTITYREFEDVVKRELNLGETYITTSEISRLMNGMDRDGDGRIDYKEFCNFILDSGINGGSSRNGTTTMVGGGSLKNDDTSFLRCVDKDVLRQLETDLPWGDITELERIFAKYDLDRRGEVTENNLTLALNAMNVRVDTSRFVRGLWKGLEGGGSSLGRSGTSFPYRPLIRWMCRGGTVGRTVGGNLGGNLGGGSTTTLSGGVSGGIGGIGFNAAPTTSFRRVLTPEELFQEDIAAATAAARTVHAAADQMAMLRAENHRLRKELSGFNVQFFEEIEDLKFAYLVQVRRADAMTRMIYEIGSTAGTNPDELMKRVEEEAGQEVDLQRNGSVGRRQRWQDLERRQQQQQQQQQQWSSSSSAARGGTRRLAPPPLRNEWEVSDQWIQLVFDMADGTALAELERQCRIYDMTNTGSVAAPELRMALRGALSNTVGSAECGTMVLAPSAMVFGELVRRFESQQSRMGGVPTVDYGSLLKAILNRGQRPTHAGWLEDDRRRENDGGRGGEDDAVMSMVREWCRRQGDDRRALEDMFNRIDENRTGQISRKEFDNALLDMKLEASRSQLDDCMRLYDRDGDGTIDWSEFVTAVLDGPSTRGGSRSGGSRSGSKWSDVLDEELRRRIEDAKWTGESLRQLFRKFDRDGSGKISVREFKEVFAEMGIPSKYADVEDLVRKIDRDGDGYVNYQEFVDAALPKRSGRNDSRYNDDRGRDRGTERGRDRGRDDRGRDSGRDRGRDDRGRDGGRNRGRDDRGRDSGRDRGRDDRGRDDRGRDRDGGRDRGRDRDVDRDRDRGRERGRQDDQRGGNRKSRGKPITDILDDKLCELIRNASWNRDSLRKLFEKFDKDRSGRITSSEFKRAFEGLGFSTSQYDVENLMRRIDADGDGSIDFNEFVNAALRPAGGGKSGSSGSYRHYAAAVDEKLRKLVRDAKFSEAAIKKLFSKFDRNGSGSITVGEFKRGFMEMGIQTSTKEITDLIDRLDR